MDTISYAKSYIKRGWPVFPLWWIEEDGQCACGTSNCEYAGKHPLGKVAPHGYQSATTDYALAEEWWGRYPKANIAIATGTVSNLLVIDMDPRSGGLDAIERLQRENYPLGDTLRAQSGSGDGVHYYFSYPGVTTKFELSEYKGLHFLSDKHYAAAPPSLTSHEYKWLNDESPAQPPSWLVDALRTADSLQEGLGAMSNISRYFEGQRRTYLSHLRGKLFNAKLSEESIYVALYTENANKCFPPLDKEEITNIMQGDGLVPFSDFTYDDIGNAKRMAYCHGSVIRYLVGGDWYVWNGRHWAADNRNAISRTAQETVQWMRAHKVTKEFEGSWEKHLKYSGKAINLDAMIKLCGTQDQVAISHDMIDNDPDLFACANKWLGLKNDTALDPTSKRIITKTTNTLYDPEAKDERWDDFIHSVVDDETRLYLQRAVGYSLTGQVTEKCFFVIAGGTNTGKTTFMESIRNMMGSYAVVASPATFLVSKHGNDGGQPRADKCALAGARLISVPELSEKTRFDSSEVKRMTGDDMITARVPYGKRNIEFLLQGKIWFYTNECPVPPTDDNAFWSRLKIIEFKHQVVRGEDMKTELLAHFRTNPRARSAILNWALEGYRMWRQSGLGVLESSEKKAAEYKRDTDYRLQWFNDRVTIKSGTSATTAGLWDDLIKYMNDRHMYDARPSITAFSIWLGRLAAERKTFSKRNSTNPPVTWEGITLMSCAGATY